MTNSPSTPTGSRNGAVRFPPAPLAEAVVLLLLLCACTTVQQPEQTTGSPPVEEPNPTVYADWSKLGEREGFYVLPLLVLE